MKETGKNNGVEDILLAITPDGNVMEYRLNQMERMEISIGRSRNNEIVLESACVSHQHGTLFLRNGKVYYQDQDSSNGTYVDILGNKKYLHHSEKQVELRDGIVLNIGGVGRENAVYLLYSLCLPSEGWKKISINRKSLAIGRSAGNDIVLSHPAVSRNHAVIEPEGNSYVLTDVSGKDRTLLNGRQLNGKVKLKECDIIQIFAYQLI